MLRLRGLGLTDCNHLMRTLDLQRRQVMLSFNLLQTLATIRDVLSIFLRLIGLQAFALEFLRITLDLAFEISSFLVDDADGGDEPLASCFFQMQTSDLRRNLESGAGELTPQTQQFLRALATGHSKLVCIALKFLEATLVEQPDVV